MDKIEQNAALWTTAVDDDGKTHITFIPLNIGIDVLKFFLENGTCDNNEAITFETDKTQEEYWKNMWDNLKEE